MAQQPNIELDPSDRPRPTPRPAPARRWSGEGRPGIITAPDQVPTGPGFGTPGPDTGWALVLIRRAGIPELTDGLEKVLSALMAARAGSFGRAPTPEDLEVARLVCGLDAALPDHLRERCERWVDATAHDRPPGRTALEETGIDLLRNDPAVVRLRLTNSE